MNRKLTTPERLRKLREERDLKLEWIEEKIQIPHSTLSNYEKNENKEINSYSLCKLAKFYNVSADYILGLTENKEQVNVPLADLHINDDMVSLLKSESINNRLLCELVTHKDFPKLLSDIEIYVDGIASMQIRNLNEYIDGIRENVQKRFDPDNEELYLKTLSAAHIDEDDYFCHKINQDLSEIIRDLRKQHKDDSLSASDVSLKEKLTQAFDSLEDAAGKSHKEQTKMALAVMKVNYSKFSEEELDGVVKLFETLGYPNRYAKKRGRGKGKGKRKG